MTDDRLQDLLASVPVDVPVPPGLDARLRASRAPTRRGWQLLAAGLVLGCLGGAALPRSAPELLLVQGTQLVRGSAELLAGDRKVSVQGRARVTVEPPQGLAREWEQEDPSMNRTHLAAALAGSLITVAVYEGRATVSGPADEDAPVLVTPGRARTVGGAPTAPRTPSATNASAPPSPSEQDVGVALAQAEQRVQGLEAELAAQSLRLALAEGQLVAARGEPQPWPEALPPGFRPEPFESALRDLLAEGDLGELLAVDCQEFPCLAVLSPPPYDGPGMPPALRALIDGMQATLGDAAVSVQDSRTRDGQGELQLTGLSFIPPDAQSEELGRRSETRMEELLQGLAEDRGGERPSQP